MQAAPNGNTFEAVKRSVCHPYTQAAMTGLLVLGIALGLQAPVLALLVVSSFALGFFLQHKRNHHGFGNIHLGKQQKTKEQRNLAFFIMTGMGTMVGFGAREAMTSPFVMPAIGALACCLAFAGGARLSYHLHQQAKPQP